MLIQIHSESKGGKRVRNAAAFSKEYARILGILDDKHELTIIVRPGFENQGQLYFEGNHSFLILKEASVNVMMQTLAHEMVHLKQFLRKELKHTKNGGLNWKGKKFSPEKMGAWVNRPWEIEAMQKEVVLHYYAMENVK